MIYSMISIFLLFIVIYHCDSHVITPASINSLDQLLDKSNITEKQCIFMNRYDEEINESIRRNTLLYKLYIKGSIIRLSDIIKLKNFCPGLTMIIQIFATKKIIIDKDFNSEGENLVFALIAPIWKIVGIRKIILNGYNGKIHKESKADDGITNGKRRGFDGKKGFSGGAGGQFQGIAGTIINENNLIIQANGGNGGQGQNGGNGAKGIDGIKFRLNRTMINENGDINGFKTILRNVIDSPKNKKHLGKGIFEIVLGKKGTDGGNGGNGGQGGDGGNAGDIEYYELNNNCEKKKFFNLPKNGNNGKDGIGGYGGVPGESRINVQLELFYPDNYKIVRVEKKRNLLYSNYSHGENGKNGSYFSRKKENYYENFQLFDETICDFDKFTNEHFEKFEKNRELEYLKQKIQKCKNNGLPKFYCDY